MACNSGASAATANASAGTPARADPHACFTRHWAAVPEDEKNWLRAGIKARAMGCRPRRRPAPPMPSWRAMPRPRRRTSSSAGR